MANDSNKIDAYKVFLYLYQMNKNYKYLEKNKKNVTLSINDTQHTTFVIMLIIIMLSVVFLNVMPSAVLLSVVPSSVSSLLVFYPPLF